MKKCFLMLFSLGALIALPAQAQKIVFDPKNFAEAGKRLTELRNQLRELESQTQALTMPTDLKFIQGMGNQQPAMPLGTWQDVLKMQSSGDLQPYQRQYDQMLRTLKPDSLKGSTNNRLFSQYALSSEATRTALAATDAMYKRLSDIERKMRTLEPKLRSRNIKEAQDAANELAYLNQQYDREVERSNVADKFVKATAEARQLQGDTERICFYGQSNGNTPSPQACGNRRR